MSQGKCDLHLVNQVFDISQDCGQISVKKAKKYIQELANYTLIPQDSCLYTLSATFFGSEIEKYFLCCNPKPKIHTKNNYYMRLGIILKNCRKCPRQDCLQNIQSGKCTDEFAREVIGKKLFAEKYQGK